MKKTPKTSIKNWAADDRPREKLLLKGIESLSDAELIAILIGSGNRSESAVELSKRILAESKNNLNELAKLSVTDLQKFKGIGEAKAISIVAALELGKRRKISEVIEKKQIKSSKDVADIFSQKLGDLPYEEFWLIILNRANKIIELKKISAGGVSGTVTDVKIILKAAIEKTASGIIVCHNHPSGNVKPSNSDVNITKKLKAACEIVDISLLDHIIVSFSDFFSFADEKIL
ncbi:MAG: DNA repair protein RadC [Bacteroidales bacterium]|nr:DNA repair protein RadC [Bacteroidales bacterium]